MIIDSIGYLFLGNLVKYFEWSVIVVVFEKEIYVFIYFIMKIWVVGLFLCRVLWKNLFVN